MRAAAESAIIAVLIFSPPSFEIMPPAYRSVNVLNHAQPHFYTAKTQSERHLFPSELPDYLSEAE
jgi:hypothetical protein